MSYSSFMSSASSEQEGTFPPVNRVREKQSRKRKERRDRDKSSSPALKLPSLAPGGPVNVVYNQPALDSDDSVSDLEPIGDDSSIDCMDYEYSEDEDHADADSEGGHHGNDNGYLGNEEDDEEDEYNYTPLGDEEDTKPDADDHKNVQINETENKAATPELDNKLIENAAAAHKEKLLLNDLGKERIKSASSQGERAPEKRDISKEKTEKSEKKKKKGGKKDGKKKGKNEDNQETARSAKSGKSARAKSRLAEEDLPEEMVGQYEFAKGHGSKAQAKLMKTLMKMSRTVVTFSKPPPRYPCTVCFNFPNTFVTHRYVMDVVREKIHFVPGGEIVELQFLELNVVHATCDLDNRWLITLNSMECRDELMRLGLFMFNKKILLRRYDEVLLEEYREYLDYQGMLKKLFNPEEAEADEAKEEEKEEEKNSKSKKKGKKGKKGKNKDDKKEKSKEEEKPKTPERKMKTPPDFLKDILGFS